MSTGAHNFVFFDTAAVAIKSARLVRTNSVEVTTVLKMTEPLAWLIRKMLAIAVLASLVRIVPTLLIRPSRETDSDFRR